MSIVSYKWLAGLYKVRYDIIRFDLTGYLGKRVSHIYRSISTFSRTKSPTSSVRKRPRPTVRSDYLCLRSYIGRSDTTEISELVKNNLKVVSYKRRTS